jgi:penicillin-binding protein 2
MKRTDKTGQFLWTCRGNRTQKRYDDVIRGVDGISYRQINAYGQMLGAMPGYPAVPPTPGDDVMLGLDNVLQHLADSLLSEFTAGTVVALDIKTGEIICLVTRPGFDANAFSGGMSATAWNALRDDSLKPLLNRAAMGLYTAGSTAKLLTLPLESGTATVYDVPYCGGVPFRESRVQMLEA